MMKQLIKEFIEDLNDLMGSHGLFIKVVPRGETDFDTVVFDANDKPVAWLGTDDFTFDSDRIYVIEE